MNKEIVLYSNKHIDPKISNLLDGLKNYFGFTTKASFVFLATYCLLNYKSKGISWEDYVIPKSPDNEFRESEDQVTDPAIDILLERVGKIKGNSFEEIRTNDALINETMNDLCKMVNAAGVYLLENDLYSFKGHKVGENNCDMFMTIVVDLLSSLEVPSLF